MPSGSYAMNVKRIRAGVVSVGVTQPEKYAGNEASQALNPLGTLKKSVPPRRRVARRERTRGRRPGIGIGNGEFEIVEESLETGESRIGELSISDDWSVDCLESVPLRKSQVSPRVSKPDQIEGPESSARPAAIPAWIRRFSLHIAHVKIRNITARIVPFA
jgi:hypothetical protein